MRASQPTRLLVTACMFTIILASTFAGFPTAEAAQRAFVVEMQDVEFRPNVLQVDPGDVVTIRVFNNGSIGHTFDIAEFNVHIGDRTNPLQPGQNASRTFTADRRGTFWFFCDIPGHAIASGSGYSGMAGRLIVGPALPPADLMIPIVILVVVAIGAGVAGLIVWRAWKPRKP